MASLAPTRASTAPLLDYLMSITKTGGGGGDFPLSTPGLLGSQFGAKTLR